MPPNPIEFGKVFPELTHRDDAWVQLYLEMMDSDIPLVAEPLSQADPSTGRYLALRRDVDQWLEREGVGFLEQVIHGKLTPAEGAEFFYERLLALDDGHELGGTP